MRKLSYSFAGGTQYLFLLYCAYPLWPVPSHHFRKASDFHPQLIILSILNLTCPIRSPMHFFEILNILYTHGGLKLRCPVFLCILIALSGLLFLLLSKVVFCFVLKWWLLTQLHMRINHKMPSGLPESNPQSSTENCHIYSY